MKMNEFEIDPIIILENLNRNSTILIAILVIFIIFFLLTVWFAYYSIYQIRQNITTINSESKEALAIITSGQLDVESTLNKINTSATETIATENDIIGFIKSAYLVQ